MSRAGGFTFGETGFNLAGQPRHPERWDTPQARAAVARMNGTAVRQQRPVRVDPTVERDAMVAKTAPRVPWDDFITNVLDWKRGEHLACIGPTGQGKTTLLFNILPLHPFTAVFGTKRQDESLDAFVEMGYQRFDRWRSVDPMQVPRRIIWPHVNDITNMERIQREVFTDAFRKIYAEGYWDLVIDEGYYIDEILKLAPLLRLFYTQARSMFVSLVLGTQRPAWVPVEVYDMSTHLFFWRDNDARNLRRLSEVNVRDSATIKAVIPELEMHQLLYLNTRTGQMCRTRCPKIAMPTGR